MRNLLNPLVWAIIFELPVFRAANLFEADDVNLYKYDCNYNCDSNFYGCSGGYGSLDSVKSNLLAYDDTCLIMNEVGGVTDGRQSNCWCGWSEIYEYRIQYSTKNTLTNIKTIIVTFGIDQFDYPFYMTARRDGQDQIIICDPCVKGANDFSDSPLTFDALFIKARKGNRLNVCQVFAYDHKNYVPESTITSELYTAGLTSGSYNPASYASNSEVRGLGGWGANDGWNSYTHSCIHAVSDGTVRSMMSTIMIEFPFPVFVKDIYVNGGPQGTKMQLFAMALSETITVTDLVDTVESVQGNGKLEQYSAGTIKRLIELEYVNTQDVSGNPLGKRFMIKNKENEDFFLCGFAIMAEPIPCPPEEQYCTEVSPPVEIISNMLIPMLETSIESDPFSFTDEITDYCTSISKEGCRQYDVLKLLCIPCSEYSDPITCSGITNAQFKKDLLVHVINGEGTDVVSVTVSTNGRLIDHNCVVENQASNTVYTNEFRVQQEACPICDEAVLYLHDTSTPVFGTIPISYVSTSADWTAFGDQVKDCGVVCSGVEYETTCRLTETAPDGEFMAPDLITDPGDPSASKGFEMEQSFSEISETNTLSFKTSVLARHGVEYQCKIVGTHKDSGSYIETPLFDVIWDICETPESSCPLNFWSVNPSASWTRPANMQVQLDNVEVQSTFEYVNWKDYFARVCGAPVCGTPIFTFIQYENDNDITGVVPAFTVTDSLVDVDTKILSVTTEDPAHGGSFNTRIKGVLDKGGIVYAGDPASAIWEYFIIDIIDPCFQPQPCLFTKLIVTETILDLMTAYVDNKQVLQEWVRFSDRISTFCGIICENYSYSLVRADDGTTIPSNFATLSLSETSNNKVSVKTLNYNHIGTTTVKIKCTIAPYNDIIDVVYSDEFDIFIDACDIRSCTFTKFVALNPLTDTTPQNFQIGVDDVPGTTTIQKFTNTCAKSCPSNPMICGEPTYTLEIASDGSDPADFISIDLSGDPLVISAQTFDLANEGDFTLKVRAVLDMSAVPSDAPLLNPYITSNDFTLTVDICDPLPCGFTQIILPKAGSVMADQIYALNDNIKVSTQFSDYRDSVSLRCTNPDLYVDSCGPKSYLVERVDGLPWSLSVNLMDPTKVGDLWQVSVQTSNEIDIGLYPSRIHAFYPNATANNIDNSEYEFEIVIDNKNPCVNLDCSRNSLVSIADYYTMPSDFTIDTKGNFGNTIFDGWNDTKTQECYDQPGSDFNGNPVDAFPWPACDDVVYRLVYADTKEVVSNTFGDIQIEKTTATLYTRPWMIKARTTNKAMDGDHLVMLEVRLNENSAPEYSNEFTISVRNPCLTYNCATTEFHTSSTTPPDIQIIVNEGWKESEQSPWSNTVQDACGSSSYNLCEINYELLLFDTDEPAPFEYEIISGDQGQPIVRVQMTDLDSLGETYQVYVRGFGFDTTLVEEFGVSGKGRMFNVIVAEEVTNIAPVFTEFPSSYTYSIDVVDGATTEDFQLVAIAQDEDGEIVKLTVSMDEGIDFITYQMDGDKINFRIKMDGETPFGAYTVDVVAEDDRGATITKTFQIFVQQVGVIIEEQIEEEEYVFDFTLSSNNETEAENSVYEEPLSAAITRISATGYLEISYNRRVIPVANFTNITDDEFHLTFEQLSFEEDQTEDFSYTLLEHTPYNIFVQLHFSQPLIISQGLLADVIHIAMRKDLFMVEDKIGLFEDWIEGDDVEQGINVQLLRRKNLLPNQREFSNTTAYKVLQKNVPKQAQDEQGEVQLQMQIKGFGVALQTLFWAPFALHLFGFGNMDLAWVLLNNLQVEACLSQFDLKLPRNVLALIESYTEIANQQFLPLEDLYLLLRRWASDEPVQLDCNQVKCDVNGNEIKNETLAEVEENSKLPSAFEISRFANKGSDDKVLFTSGQMLVSLLVLLVIGCFGIAFEKSIYHWFPKNFKKAYTFVKNFVYWCLPIRIMIQSYMSVTFSAFLNIRFQNNTDTLENQVNRVSSILIIIFYSVGFPILIFGMLKYMQKRLFVQSVFRNFGSLYLSIDYQVFRKLPITTLSLLRKFLLIFLAVVFDMNVIQFACALYIQQMFTVYLLLVRPMEGFIRNQVENFNEICIFTIILMMCTLTDYVPDPAIRYNVSGWIIIYIMFVQVVVNAFFLILSIVQQIKRIYKIIRYKVEMDKRRIQVENHNKTVDRLGRHNTAAHNEQYKLKPIIVEQATKPLEPIHEHSSIRDDSSSEISSVKLLPEIKVKTIKDRKREFLAMMKELEKTENINQIKEINLPEQEQNVDVLVQRLQEGNHWPVSPRQAMMLQQVQDLPADTRQVVERREWFAMEGDRSGASDWNALPKEFENDFGNSVNMSELKEEDSAELLQKHNKKKRAHLQWRPEVDDSFGFENSKEASRWRNDDSEMDLKGPTQQNNKMKLQVDVSHSRPLEDVIQMTPVNHPGIKLQELNTEQGKHELQIQFSGSEDSKRSKVSKTETVDWLE